jgi:sugar lactone lactonase YvrE
LIELSPNGDTLRTVTRDFTAQRVTDEDMERARVDMEWFISQGGKVDWSRIPDTKPAADNFYLDDGGHVWVLPTLPNESERRALDVFDASGRYLGRVSLPFPLSRRTRPVIRGATLVAVTEDEFEVPYVVRAKILRQ